MQTLSIRYLNFPTIVIFKSAKLLPVMAVNALWLGQRQQPLDVVAALLLCAGLMLFSIADSKLHPGFDVKGVMLVLISLCADSCISNLQEATMKFHKTPVLEMVSFVNAISWNIHSHTCQVLYSHTFALAFLLPTAAIAGELAAGFWCLTEHPSTLGLMVLFCTCGFLGA